MEVEFVNKKFGIICSSKKELITEYGSENARKIMLRLNELSNVENLSMISPAPPSRRHKLHGKREGQFAVDLKQPYRLVFKAGNKLLPKDNNGNIDLERITKVIILEVTDYHGE